MSRFRFVMAAGVLATLVMGGNGAASDKQGNRGDCQRLLAILRAAPHMSEAALAQAARHVGAPEGLTGQDLIDYLQKLATEACD